VARVTAIGATSRRPAPVSSDLLVVERLIDGDTSRLWIIDRKEARERALELEDAPAGPLVQREPFVHRGKSGKVRLAYTQLVDTGDGEPHRFDVCIARLRGVSLDDSDHPHHPHDDTDDASAPVETADAEPTNP